MGETPLLIFSFFMQAAIGLLWFLAVGKKLYKNKKFKVASVAAAALSIIGVLASLAHLGSPLMALSTLSNVGGSWLSKEVLLAGIFMGIVLLYVIVQYKFSNESIEMVLAGLGSAVGFVLVFAMAKVYTTTSISVWQGTNTFVDFYATTIAVGALLFIVFSLKELENADKKIYGFIILAAVTIQAAVAAANPIELSVSSAVIGLKWLLVLGGAGILIWPISQKLGATKNQTGILYLAVVAIVMGELIGRYVFYTI